MLASLLRNIELWLSTAGLLVVWAGATLLSDPDSMGHVASLLALAMNVVHGVIFWLVRRRQRTVRNEAIHEIREMVADRVKNQLAVMQMYLPASSENDELALAIGGVREGVAEITAAIDTLSNESLTSWKARYATAIANGTLALTDEAVGAPAMLRVA